MYTGDQLWICANTVNLSDGGFAVCGEERKWGEGRPEKLFNGKDELFPLLYCARCKTSTRHQFSRVDHDYLAAVERAKNSPLMHRFE